MATRAAGRLWLLGGVVVITLLITAMYLLAIKPVYDDQALKESQVEEMDIQLVKLKQELSGLKAKSEDIATYTAQLAAKKTQLPDSYDVTNFLRQLQDSDGNVKVDNNSIGVSTPVAVNGSSIVVGVPMTLTATGKPAALTSWLDRLLHKQTRATLIDSATLQGETDDDWTANVTITIFCGKNDDNDCKVATA